MMENTLAKPSFKRCFVKVCGNTTHNTSNKHFFPVPTLWHLRERWLAAAQRDADTTHNTAFCCQDHFKLEEDAENWMRYKLTGNVRLKLKFHAVPHIFDHTKSPCSEPPIINVAETSPVEPPICNLAPKQFRIEDLMKDKRIVREALRALKRKKRDERRFLKEQKRKKLRVESDKVLQEQKRQKLRDELNTAIEKRYVPIILRKAQLNLFPEERLDDGVTQGEPVGAEPFPKPIEFVEAPTPSEGFFKEEVIYEDYGESGWMFPVKQEGESGEEKILIKEEPADSYEVVSQ